MKKALTLTAITLLLVGCTVAEAAETVKYTVDDEYTISEEVTVVTPTVIKTIKMDLAGVNEKLARVRRQKDAANNTINQAKDRRDLLNARIEDLVAKKALIKEQVVEQDISK